MRLTLENENDGGGWSVFVVWLVGKVGKRSGTLLASVAHFEQHDAVGGVKQHLHLIFLSQLKNTLSMVDSVRSLPFSSASFPLRFLQTSLSSTVELDKPFALIQSTLILDRERIRFHPNQSQIRSSVNLKSTWFLNGG